MDEKLLLTYSFLKGLLKSYNYIPIISKEIEDRFSKNIISKSNEEISNKIEYELSQFEIIDIKLFMIVFESFRSKYRIKINYTNQSDEQKDLLVEPLKLLNYQGNWYLIAHIPIYDNPTIFNFSRINSIILSENPYENKITESYLNKYLDENFGIFKNSDFEESHRHAIIRFYNTARNITQNQVFHKKQEVKFGEDSKKGKYVEFNIQVKHYHELMGKVLQYGADGEVIEPADFRNLWLAKIKDMYDRYCIS